MGQLGGGWRGQRLYNTDLCYQIVLMGGSTLLSVGPMLYLINTQSVGDGLFYFMAVLAGACISINGPNVRAVLQVHIVIVTLMYTFVLCHFGVINYSVEAIHSLILMLCFPRRFFTTRSSQFHVGKRRGRYGSNLLNSTLISVGNG